MIEQDKDEEKARKTEEKRLAKEKRKSTKSEPAGSLATVAAPEPAETTIPVVEVEPAAEPEHEHATATVAERHEESSTPAPIRTSMEDQASLRMRENASAANKDEVTPMSPSSPESGGKVRNWLKTKFSRRISKVQKPSVENADKGDKAFVGGAALTGASAQNNSNPSLGAKSSSVRDVAMAGKGKEPAVEEPEERPGRSATSSVRDVTMAGKGKEPAVEEPEERPGRSATSSVRDVTMADKGKEPAVEEPEERPERSARRDEEVSSLSSMGEEGESGKEEDDDFQEARDNFDEDVAPPPTIPAEKSPSPIKDSKFTEEI